jgi:phosphate:Na+ symporter
METTLSYKIIPLLLGLFGGLALFLFGLEQMTTALKGIAGNRLKNMFSRMTANRFKGALTGTFVTAIIQSSSITTVLVVGFISAGLINLKQAISIIMGAHVGTTLTVQIIAFKVTELAFVMIIVGFGLKLLVKQDKIKHLGLMILGIGLIFLGMNLMSESTYPLRSYKLFLDLMSSLENPLLAILAATAFTALIQTSAATIGIVITLASQGLISLEAGIALTFGANIGTCMTAILASIGTPREGKQAALSHIIVNVIGVLIWIPFVYYLAEAVKFISPSFPNLSGINRIAAEAPRQIANAHTIFNVVNTILFLPFITPLAKFISWILPAKPVEEPEKVRPKYLDDVFLRTPALALERVRLELGRQSKRALIMINEISGAVLFADKSKLKKIKKMDDDIDALHEFIISYLSKLSKKELSNTESSLLQSYIIASNYIEYIGDVIETNLVTLGRERVEAEIEFSKKSEAFLIPFFEKVTLCAQESFASLIEGNKQKAQAVIDMKAEVNHLSELAQIHLEGRLQTEKDIPLTEYRILSDIVENMKRIYYLSKRIAKDVVESKAKNHFNSAAFIQEEIKFDE